MCARDMGLVYGGASIGLMGRIADTVLKHGGEAIGVIPDALFKSEVAHDGLSEMITVDSMHQRKEKMANLADGFIALPGGFGTLEEVFEAITWSQLRIQVKPIGLLNVSGYYDRLQAFIDNCVEQGFIRPEHAALYVMENDPESLIVAMEKAILRI